MNVCILVSYGDDLTLSVDMADTTINDAITMLGSVATELLRLNMALTMQAEA